MRAAGKDSTVVLSDPIPVSLDYALEYIVDDELVEVRLLLPVDGSSLLFPGGLFVDPQCDGLWQGCVCVLTCSKWLSLRADHASVGAHAQEPQRQEAEVTV